MQLKIPDDDGGYTEWTRCLGGWQKVRADRGRGMEEWVSTRFFHTNVSGVSDA